MRSSPPGPPFAPVAPGVFLPFPFPPDELPAPADGGWLRAFLLGGRLDVELDEFALLELLVLNPNGELSAEVDVREREGWERTESERNDGGSESLPSRAGASSDPESVAPSRRVAKAEGDSSRECLDGRSLRLPRRDETGVVDEGRGGSEYASVEGDAIASQLW